MRVAFVLRSGGEYTADHVLRLRDQVRAHLDAPIICLSDVAVEGVETIPLKYNWPGWWSKMELFRPDLDGDLLFFDLDTSIVGDLADIAAINRLAIMRDVYRPHGLQSSIMYVPDDRDRETIWSAWMVHPARRMREHRRGGDQEFLERFWLPQACRWQDALPGQVVSYKADVLGKGVPENARVVVFHGKPRPWQVGW